jgi:hypothetical protein
VSGSLVGVLVAIFAESGRALHLESGRSEGTSVFEVTAFVGVSFSVPEAVALATNCIGRGILPQ